MSKEIKSFDAFYTQIYSTLESLEVYRSRGASTINSLYKYGAVGIIVALVLFFILPVGFVLFLFLIYFAILFGKLIETVRRTSKEIKPTFKKDVIQALLNYFYEEVRYDPRQRISVKLLQRSLLFEKRVYRNTGDDFTECKIGDTYICFSEVQAYSRSSSYFFNGIFIAVAFNKSFTSKTIVLPNSRTSLFRKIKMNIMGVMQHAKMIKLEDSVFNKEFDVISEDQVESRYLLSTSLMQRLLDYKQKINKNVSFSFIDNWFYVSIPTKVNMFEASISNSLTDKEFIKSNYDYFQLLTGLVEDLDLNTKIWK